MQRFFTDIRNVKDMEVLLAQRVQLKTEMEILTNLQAKEDCHRKIVSVNQRIGKLYRNFYLDKNTQV